MEEEQSRIVLEVHPKYLVIDTNTYVDHLEGITRIFTCKEDFSIVVPTVGIFYVFFMHKIDFLCSKSHFLNQNQEKLV